MNGPHGGYSYGSNHSGLLCDAFVYADGSGSEPICPSRPPTPKHPVTDEYQGVKVTDDYRWLEDGDAPQTKQWVAGEDARTRAYLDHLPARAAVRDRMRQLISATSARCTDLQFRGGTLFALKYQPPQQQATVVALRSADDPGSAKVVFDPNTVKGKEPLSVDFYVPSLDGKYVAIASSSNGSEDLGRFE